MNGADAMPSAAIGGGHSRKSSPSGRRYSTPPQVLSEALAEDLSPGNGAEELDMFDIELQREFQTGGACGPSPGKVPPPVQPPHGNVFCCVRDGSVSSPFFATGPMPTASRTRVVATATGRGLAPADGWVRVVGAPTPPTSATVWAPANGADGLTAKQFPSVAGACQMSVFTQDREESMRLVHLLANQIRREVNVSTPDMAHTTSNTTSAVAEAHSFSPVVSTTFEEDLALVTMIIHEINHCHNPAWRSPYTPASAALSMAALRGTPPAGSYIATRPAHAGGGHRASPTTAQATSTGGTSRGPNNNDRSTIDTEVSDSLDRLRRHSISNGHHSQVSTMPASLVDCSYRPANPYHGMPHATYAAPLRHAAPGMYQQQMLDHYSGAGVSCGMPHHAVTQQPVVRGGGAGLAVAAMQRKVTRSGSGSLAHPRAVKPMGGKGRSRGPRSQTGKNVAPSNHSAFSECSAGETRSYQSTNLEVHHNTSSVNATTNTSMTSASFRQHSMTIQSGVANGANGVTVIGAEGIK